MTSVGLLVTLAAAIATQPSVVPPRTLAVPAHPFRLSLSYTRVVAEYGSLAKLATVPGTLPYPFHTQAVSLHWAFPSSTYVRTHFAIGYQWEDAGPYKAHGLRADLISFGYPIRLVEGELTFSIEPIVTPVRTELVFPEGGDQTVLRMEAGAGLEFLLVTRAWYLGIEPVHVDFRYWYWARYGAFSKTGFSQVFPVQIAVGREF